MLLSCCNEGFITCFEMLSDLNYVFILNYVMWKWKYQSNCFKGPFFIKQYYCYYY